MLSAQPPPRPPSLLRLAWTGPRRDARRRGPGGEQSSASVKLAIVRGVGCRAAARTTGHVLARGKARGQARGQARGPRAQQDPGRPGPQTCVYKREGSWTCRSRELPHCRATPSDATPSPPVTPLRLTNHRESINIDARLGGRARQECSCIASVQRRAARAVSAAAPCNRGWLPYRGCI